MIEGLLFNITQRMTSLMLMLGEGIIGRPGATPGPVSEGVGNAANGIIAPPPAAAEGGGMWIMIVYAGVLIVVMYFLMFRGPRKREKKMKEMQSSIRTGDNVVVTGGMFGRIADIGEDCFIVEFGTNRGIRIPVLKSDVLGVREPKLTPPPKVD